MATARDWGTRENLATALSAIGPDGNLMNIANVLVETNDIIGMMPTYGSNETLSYVGARDTTLPTAQIVKVGAGWDASTSEFAPFRETISQFKDRMQIPKDVLKLQPDKQGYMRMRARRHIVGMGQSFANHLMYGNDPNDPNSSTPAPEKFDGLSLRRASINESDKLCYDNGESSGSVTSMWFIQPGPGQVFLTHPKNHASLGIEQEDKGEVLISAENSKNRWDLIVEFAYDVGLVVEDERCLKRLANINPDYADAQHLDTNLMIKILNAFPRETQGPVYIVVNETVFTQLDILTQNKTNVYWDKNSPYGKPQLMFRDSPVMRCDAVLDTESVLS